MKTSRFLAGVLTILGVGLFLFATACDDETSPDISPTLEAIWPNENGRAWEFTVTTSIFEPPADPDTSWKYSNYDDVPPAPSINAILPLIDHPPLPDSVRIATELWGLQFQDSITTESGVTAQNLVEFPGGLSASGPAVTGGTRPMSTLVAQLQRARPDLAQALLGRSLDFQPIFTGPIFLHGGAWERTESWIGTYGDFDTQLVWKYLDATLSSGHSFTHQIITTIADDIYLHVLVRRQVTVDTPVGVFPDVLEVVYLLDYGVLQVTEVGSTDPFYYFRAIDYGAVWYAPTIGPVAVYERALVPVSETLGLGIGELSLELVRVDAGPELLTAAP